MEWVSMKERLPELDKLVSVRTPAMDFDCVFMFKKGKKYFFRWGMTFFESRVVTHWRPIVLFPPPGEKE